MATLHSSGIAKCNTSYSLWQHLIPQCGTPNRHYDPTCISHSNVKCITWYSLWQHLTPQCGTPNRDITTLPVGPAAHLDANLNPLYSTPNRDITILQHSIPQCGTPNRDSTTLPAYPTAMRNAPLGTAYGNTLFLSVAPQTETSGPHLHIPQHRLLQ
jgi:hypothetical protein